MLETGCFLCEEKHPPQFYCFAHRTFVAEEQNGKETGESAVAILVPRIICEINHRIRKETGEAKQYTLTVLPGFLIPYSTIPVDPVHRAVNSYLTESGLKQVGAALRMRCRSSASFQLFYSRILERVEAWTTLFVQMIIALGGNVREAKVSQADLPGPIARWNWFVRLSTVYVGLYARLPGSPVIPQKYLRQYIYTLLSRHHMGLGP